MTEEGLNHLIGLYRQMPANLKGGSYLRFQPTEDLHVEIEAMPSKLSKANWQLIIWRKESRHRWSQLSSDLLVDILRSVFIKGHWK